MKKQKLTYRIIRTMSEEQVKDVGFNRFAKKHIRVLYGGIVLSVAAFLLGMAFLRGNQIISVIPGVLFAVWWFNSSIKEGKRVLDFVKGKEQSIDLDLMD